MPNDDIRGPKWNFATGIPDLTGKVAIVTGANSSIGIGFNIAYQLALHGAKVYVGARSASKAHDAIAEMKKASASLGKTLDLKPLVIDLVDFKQVKACANTFVKDESRLDILVNNAALVPRPFDKEANGISLSFATNHLGPFLFTLELLPLLKKTAAAHPGVRVVTLASVAHTFVKPGARFSSLQDFNVELGGTDDINSNLQRYGLSKLANILFTKELQKRFDMEHVDAIAITLHPGDTKTDGAIRFVGTSSEWLPHLEEALTPLDGAVTPLFAATSPEVWAEKQKYKGQYLMPYGVVEEPSQDARSEELAQQLWETSETVLQSVLENKVNGSNSW